MAYRTPPRPQREPLTHPAMAAADERTALGLAMLDPAHLVSLLALLTPEDYGLQHHGALHRLFADLHRRGEPVDVLTVPREAHRQGWARFGGPEYVLGLTDRIPSAARSMEPVVAAVRDAAARRRLHEVGLRAVALARGDEARPVMDPHAPAYAGTTGREAVESVLRDLAAIPAGPARSAWSSGAEAWRDENAAHDRGEAPPQWPTGYRSLDDRLNGGPRGGQLLVLGGRPGQGKTAMATGIAVSTAMQGHGVAYFPMEVTPGEWQSRCVSILSGLPFGAVLQRNDPRGLASALTRGGMHGWETTEAWEAMLDASDRLQALPLHAYDAPHVSLADVSTATRRLMARHPIRAVVVDYVQRMKHGRSSRYDLAVGETIVGLKNLARELGIVVWALVQLNRGVDGRRGGVRSGMGEGDWLTFQGIPRASDIREAGQIEQEADAILYPVHPVEETLELPGVSGDEAALVWAKNRNGPVGIDRGWSWDGPRAQYMDAPPGGGLLP